jgi:hypothetical protein
MWEAIKKALVGVKDATGIEIPALPADLGSIADSARAAVASVAESGAGGIEGAAPALDAVAGTVAGASQSAATAVADAGAVLPDVAAGIIGDIPAK